MNQTLCDRCGSGQIRYSPSLGNNLKKEANFHLCWDCHNDLEGVLRRIMPQFLLDKPRTWMDRLMGRKGK